MSFENVPKVEFKPLHTGQKGIYKQRTKRNVIRCGRRYGKALALDTPIPTPGGWTTMGELQVGDLVFDEQGNPCKVTFVTEVQHGRPCNRVVFSDGQEIIADDDHLWLTWDKSARKNTARGYPKAPSVRTTSEIAATITYGLKGEHTHSIPTTAIQGPVWDFMIPPYVLGAWLGDGCSDGARLACNDQQIIDEILKEGQLVHKLDAAYMWALGTPKHKTKTHEDSLVHRLRKIGVLGDKHIPVNYLRCSYAQRLALLQGLMDTDGYATLNGACEFTNCNKALADGVMELVMSLGIKATMSIGRATLNGKDCGEKYRVGFSTSLPVFRLTRKLERITRARKFNINHRFIVSVQSVATVPVKCIQVDSPSHLYLAGRGFIATHNTTMFEQLASSWAMHGQKVGFFAPSHKLWSPSFTRILDVVYPAVKHSNKSQGLITLHNGAEIEFWTLSDEDAGRSRFYDHAIIDEASLVPGLRDIWEKSIAPTLLDRGGDAWMAGTPKGIDEESYFYLACTDKTLLEKWQEFHAPTSANPLLDAEAVAHLQQTNLPLVWAQEYCAEFVSWAGEALMSLDDMLINGQGVPYPSHCDYIYATIDSAMKDGTEHDGTAVCYWARNLFAGTPAILLDWDIQQISAATLTDWLPNVLDKMVELGNECGARHPPMCWVEDKSSGTLLIQHAQGKGWPVEAIDGKVTAQGKDGRALLASSPIHMGMVKLSQYAHDKVVAYKGVTRNHLESQVCGYRINDKDAAKRADDLSDAFTYGVIAALGTNEGF